MIKNKWFIGFVILLVIVFVFINFGNSSSVVTTPINTIALTKTIPVVKNNEVTSKSIEVKSTNASDQYVVYYTNKGFSPKEYQVPQGKLVKFINDSDKALLIVTDDTNNSVHSELNQSKTIGRGGVYTFNFTYTGVWSFHNVNNPSDHGNIVVY